MSTVSRNRKIGGTNQFDTEFDLGFKDIRADEVDADFNTIFDAWNTQLPNAMVAGGVAPTGPAGGDLVGTYPNPTVARLNGALIGVTTPLTRGDILVADGTPALKRLPLGTASLQLQSNGTDVVWGTPLGGPPSGSAGGDLAGTYPNPTIKVSGVAPAIYGDATHVPVLDVRGDGRIFGATLAAIPTSFPPSGTAGGSLVGSYPNPTLAVGSVSSSSIVRGGSAYLQPNTVVTGSQSSNLNISGTVIVEQTPTLDITRPVLVTIHCNVWLQKLNTNATTCTVNVILYAGGVAVTDGTMLTSRSVTYQTVETGDRLSIPVSYSRWYIPASAGALRFKIVATGSGGDYQMFIDVGASLAVMQFA